jgi:hypothetical protein
MHSRNAAGWPSSANSTALRVKTSVPFSSSPLGKAALLRGTMRHAGGVARPDPFRKVREREPDISVKTRHPSRLLGSTADAAQCYEFAMSCYFTQLLFPLQYIQTSRLLCSLTASSCRQRCGVARPRPEDRGLAPVRKITPQWVSEGNQA